MIQQTAQTPISVPTPARQQQATISPTSPVSVPSQQDPLRFLQSPSQHQQAQSAMPAPQQGPELQEVLGRRRSGATIRQATRRSTGSMSASPGRGSDGDFDMILARIS